MSKIALVITDKETNAQIQHLGVSLLEIRVDLFKKRELSYVVAQIKKRRLLKIPLLLTVRNQKHEGAIKPFSDDEKWQVLSASIGLVDYIDIELSSPLLKQTVLMAHKLGKQVIVSSHHFDRMPDDLNAILKKSLSARADIVKIASHASSFDDVMSMLNFTRRHQQHALITMCLGAKGSISRLLLPSVGSLYTYSFLHQVKAPGQIDIVTLKKHLKFFYL